MRRMAGYLNRYCNDYAISVSVVILALLVAVTWLLCWLPAEPWPTLLSRRDFFKPAVAAACGHGLILYNEAESPELAAFLKREKDFLLPAELPEEFSLRTDLDPFLQSHVYLLWAVSLIWRICGVSWQALYLLNALLFALTGLVVYGILRLGMMRLPAFFFTVVFLLSPGTLSVLPDLRDFSKAPFILGTIFIMGLLVKKRMGGIRIWMLAAVLGLVEGIGLGFRADLLITVLPGVLVLLFFIPSGPGRKHLFIRIVAVVINLSVFCVAGQPVLDKIREDAGGEASHNITGGFGENILDAVGLDPASYQLLHRMDDHEIHAVIASYGVRVHRLPMPEEFMGAMSGKAGREFIRHVFRTFPADIISRGWASVMYVCGGAEPDKYLFSSTFLNRLEKRVRPLAAHLDAWKIFYLVAALTMLAAYRLRLAFAVFMALVYFGGYPSLQFQHRHAFHLSLAGFWLCGFVLSGLLLFLYRFSTCREWRREILDNPRAVLAPPAKRAALFGIIILLSVFIPFFCAQCWQHYQVKSLLGEYRQAQMKELMMEKVESGDQIFYAPRAPLPDFIGPETVVPHDRHMEVHSAYLALDFEARQTVTPVTIEYRQPDGNPWLTHTLKVRVEGQDGPVRTRLFFPVYQFGVINGQGAIEMPQFAGVSLPAASRASDVRLSRVLNIDDFPFLLTLVLQENEKGFRYRHTLNFHHASAERNIERALKNQDYSRAVALLYRDFSKWCPEEEKEGEIKQLINLLVSEGNYFLERAQAEGIEKFRYKAVDLFKEAWLLWLDNRNSAGMLSRKALLDLVRKLLEEGRFHKAEGLISRVPDLMLPSRDLYELRSLLYLSNGDEEKALEVLREAVPLFPEDAWFYDRISRILSGAGKYDALLREWQSLVDGHPDVSLAWLFLGLAHEQREEYDAAQLSIGKALALNPESEMTAKAFSRVLCRIASRALSEGALDEASAYLERARSLDPESAEVRGLRGRLLAACGRNRDAIPLLHEAIENEPHDYNFYDAITRHYVRTGNLDGLLSEWKGAVEKHPDFVLAWFSLGLAHEQRGEYDAAQASYEKALELDPESEVTEKALSRVLFERASGLFSRNEIEEASVFLERAREFDPENIELCGLNAEILVARGRIDEAKPVLRAVIEEKPHDYRYYNMLAGLYMDAGDPDGLLSEWKGAVEKHPDFDLAWFSLGLAHEQRSEYDAAQASYEKALELDPESEVTAKALSRLFCRQVSQALSQDAQEEAAYFLERAREFDPENIALYGLNAEILIARDRKEEAKPVLRSMIEKMPHDYRYYDLLSTLYVEAGDLDGLLAEWKAAVEKHPDCRLALFSLGLAHERRGEYEAALHAYEKAHEIDAKAGGTAEALQRVRARLEGR